MKANHPARIALTMFTLCVALALLGAGGYFIFWYWRTGGVMGSRSVMVTPQSAAEIATSSLGGRQPVPSLAIAGKGNIFGGGGGRGNNGWRVNVGVYRMLITQPDKSIAYNYQFTVQRHAAFAGDEQKLMDLGWDLCNNLATERESAAPAALIEKLRASPANWPTFQIKMSDALSAPCGSLWEQYVVGGTEAEREKIGTQLLQGVSDACLKAMPANRADYSAAVAQVRAIISVQEEKDLRAAIARAQRAARAAAAPVAPANGAVTRPAIRPPVNRPAVARAATVPAVARVVAPVTQAAPSTEP